MRVMCNNAEDILEQDVLLGDELLDDEDSLSGSSDEMYEHFSIVVDKGQKMLRLDKFLVDRMEHCSRNRIQQAADNGLLLVNGVAAKSSYKVKPLDHITFVMPYPKRELEIIPEDIPLNIVYEDDSLIIVNKQPGMVVHPGCGNYTGTLVNALTFYLKDIPLFQKGDMRAGLVHRIDKDTSGLLAVATNDLAHTMLASQLKDHSMYRMYDAIVCGTFRENSGTVDAPIGRHPSDRKKMCVTARNSKEAVTHWEVVKRYRGYTHIRCKLETGRTHQIRVHMAHIGHPLLGDVVYGHKKPELGQDSQCLHAGALCFAHPRDGHPVMVFAELPEYFKKVIEKLEKMT